MRLAVQHVECFHLVLLRNLEARLDRSWWVVKGGSCELVVDRLSVDRLSGLTG